MSASSQSAPSRSSRLARAAAWPVSLLCSLVLLLLICGVWVYLYQESLPESYELLGQTDLDRYWQAVWLKDRPQDTPLPTRLPTGVFIETFRFVDATTVNLTGYVWHRYTRGVHDGIKRECVLFPEAVGEVVCDPVSTHTSGAVEVELRAFDVTVRQPFDYRRYPLDRQRLWLRMRSRSFDGSALVLTPDFGSYSSTEPAARFGLDPLLDPGGWRIRGTFFSYIQLRYGSSFGAGGPIDTRGAPELAFNIMLQRTISDGFIINAILLGVIFLLLFATLLMISTDEARGARFDMSTANVLAICSGMFFAIIVAHVQVRQQFQGAPMTYLEYFYLVAYLNTLAVALNAYLAHSGAGSRLGIVRYRDNLIPKLLFWPVTLGLLLIVSLWVSMSPRT